jgi:hypothetical protein
MTVHWFVTMTALVAALMAWRHARRTSTRLEQLSQLYWDLKYEHGELQAHVRRLTAGDAPAEAVGSESRPLADPAAKPHAFVPLASLKR